MVKIINNNLKHFLSNDQNIVLGILIGKCFRQVKMYHYGTDFKKNPNQTMRDIYYELIANRQELEEFDMTIMEFEHNIYPKSFLYRYLRLYYDQIIEALLSKMDRISIQSQI